MRQSGRQKRPDWVHSRPFMAKLLLLNGPNLNLLGEREPDKYGSQTLPAIEQGVSRLASELGHSVACFQSNAESELVERIQSRRLVSGRDGPGSIEHHGDDAARDPGMRASRASSRGRRPVGPRAPAGPTRVPTPGCRSRPAGLARGRRRNAVASGYRSARSDRPWLEVLDVISVPRSLAAPSGKTYVTNQALGGSTLLSTSFGRGPAEVSTSYAPLWTEGGQPGRGWAADGPCPAWCSASTSRCCYRWSIWRRSCGMEGSC